MTALIKPGIVPLTQIGLPASVLGGSPPAEYLQNPERFEFFDVANITLRYRINSSNAFASTSVGAASFSSLTGNATDNASLLASLTTQTINAQTGTTYTLVLADAGQQIDMNNAGANTLTIPLNAAVAFAVGTTISVRQVGAGTTTIAFAGTVQKPAARSLAISAQYESAVLTKIDTDTWSIVCS